MTSDSKCETVLVTAALPYANGSIHLGHLVEYIQTDIYVRFLKLTGREAIYVCADDTHGTPIEINARRQGMKPEDFIARYQLEHERDFAAFDVDFDIFYTTHSEENRRWAYRIYDALREGGHIEERSVEQLYCEEDARFLPDRFVKGTCPKCSATDQYGDVCERCNATYDPTGLEGAVCALCGRPPARKTSSHLFVRLEDFTDFLKGWTTGGALQPEIRNFVEGWLRDGLRPWCVTRDGPYFGFEVPDRPGKFFYVWLDAPIGYISSTERWAKQNGRTVEEFWSRPGARIIHFIGKDIVYFHTLFWPAVLEGAGLALPSKVVVHGMLSINGEKMSKTRGTFINAREYLDYLDPTWLRYYYAGNLSARPDDLDLNFDDFRHRINSELVNNIANLCHRSISFVGSRLDGTVGRPSDASLHARALALMDTIKKHYESLEFRKAIRSINELADLGNVYFQEQAPWKSVKTDVEAARGCVTECVNIAGLLAVALEPVVPGLSSTIHEILGTRGRSWDEAAFDISERRIGSARPLVERVAKEQVEALLSRGSGAAASLSTASKKTVKEAPRESGQPDMDAKSGEKKDVATVDYEHFAALSMKAGRVLEAKRVKKADRLLELLVDVGEEQPRTVVAGIAEAYSPEELPGRTVVVLVNLEPRKLRGIVSQGMILAASGGGKDLRLVEVPDEVPPGTPVS